MNPEISVVIPCYKSGVGLSNLVSKTEKNLSLLAPYEILLICDDCPADSWELIQKISSSSPNVKGFLLGKNVGQHLATKFGILQSKGSIILTMDDDGQHNPDSIQLLFKALSDGFDLVYATPYIDEHSILRNWASRSFKLVIAKLQIIGHARTMSSFRIFRRDILNQKLGIENFDGPLDSYFDMITNRITSVKTHMNKRTSQKSNYDFLSLMNYALNLSIRSSEKLMVYFSVIGVLGVVTCISMFLIIAVLYFFGRIVVPGYTSLFLALTFGFSINFFMIGLLGKMSHAILAIQQKVQPIWLRASTRNISENK